MSIELVDLDTALIRFIATLKAVDLMPEAISLFGRLRPVSQFDCELFLEGRDRFRERICLDSRAGGAGIICAPNDLQRVHLPYPCHLGLLPSYVIPLPSRKFQLGLANL